MRTRLPCARVGGAGAAADLRGLSSSSSRSEVGTAVDDEAAAAADTPAAFPAFFSSVSSSFLRAEGSEADPFNSEAVAASTEKKQVACIH